jgi:hypothetical protein
MRFLMSCSNGSIGQLRTPHISSFTRDAVHLTPPCTARHGVGSQAAPPRIEGAMRLTISTPGSLASVQCTDDTSAPLTGIVIARQWLGGGVYGDTTAELATTRRSRRRKPRASRTARAARGQPTESRRCRVSGGGRDRPPSSRFPAWDVARSSSPSRPDRRPPRSVDGCDRPRSGSSGQWTRAPRG